VEDITADEVNEAVWRAARQTLYPDDPMPEYLPNNNNEEKNEAVIDASKCH
jgi:hypothetical protein